VGGVLVRRAGRSGVPLYPSLVTGLPRVRRRCMRFRRGRETRGGAGGGSCERTAGDECGRTRHGAVRAGSFARRDGVPRVSVCPTYEASLQRGTAHDDSASLASLYRKGHAAHVNCTACAACTSWKGMPGQEAEEGNEGGRMALLWRACVGAGRQDVVILHRSLQGKGPGLNQKGVRRVLHLARPHHKAHTRAVHACRHAAMPSMHALLSRAGSRTRQPRRRASSLGAARRQRLRSRLHARGWPQRHALRNRTAGLVKRGNAPCEYPSTARQSRLTLQAITTV
jgi:hypothetical protein